MDPIFYLLRSTLGLVLPRPLLAFPHAEVDVTWDARDFRVDNCFGCLEIVRCKFIDFKISFMAHAILSCFCALLEPFPYRRKESQQNVRRLSPLSFLFQKGMHFETCSKFWGDV